MKFMLITPHACMTFPYLHNHSFQIIENMNLVIVLLFLLLGSYNVSSLPVLNLEVSSGSITEKYQAVADEIRNFLTQGEGKGQTYAKLANMTDFFGPRLATSTAFSLAAEYVREQLLAAGVDKVTFEPVANIPLWSRGDPNPGGAALLQPRYKDLSILALGNSTATPTGGITAKAIVVRSFDELAALPAEKVQGRIVVYNQPWLGYSASGRYRSRGAIEAAKRGAVAALVRSLTGQSLYTPHTGQKSTPEPGVPDIPVASITVEDAELLDRLQQAGHDLQIFLELNTQYYGTGSSFNIVADYLGSLYPQEMVMFGGHFDSWDVGEGAMDDGGGVAISWQTLATMAKLGLRPKRTLRAVFWTAEEWGYIGADAFYEQHKSEADLISLAMESDTGTFTPFGINFNGSSEARAIMLEVLNLLKPINAANMVIGGAGGDNADFIRNHGVPGIELNTIGRSDTYFWYHHSHADSMSMMNSSNMDLCATVFSTIAYVVADLDTLLPRGSSMDDMAKY